MKIFCLLVALHAQVAVAVTENAAAYMRLSNLTDQCASWCNPYTCDHTKCLGCYVCEQERNGTYCAVWCNNQTMDMSLCKGCEHDLVNCVREHGSACCSHSTEAVCPCTSDLLISLDQYCPIGTKVEYEAADYPLQGDMGMFDRGGAGFDRGYPARVPPRTFHGSAFYFGWTSTNGFVRTYDIQYGRLTFTGENKHGLWKWTVPGYPAGPQIHWCHVGGSFPTGGDGDAYNMEALMNEIALSPAGQDPFGPLAIAAGLPVLSTQSIQLQLQHQHAKSWLNLGNATHPFWKTQTQAEADKNEYYLMMANYDELLGENFGGFAYEGGTSSPLCTAEEILDGMPGPDRTKGEQCAGPHYFVVVVTPEGVSSQLPGITTGGLHYGKYETTEVGCPGACGAGPCGCDSVLVDLSLEAKLEDTYHWIPKWTSSRNFEDIPETGMEGSAKVVQLAPFIVFLNFILLVTKLTA